MTVRAFLWGNNTLMGFSVLKPGETFFFFLVKNNHYKKVVFAHDLFFYLLSTRIPNKRIFFPYNRVNLFRYVLCTLVYDEFMKLFSFQVSFIQLDNKTLKKRKGVQKAVSQFYVSFFNCFFL